MTENPYPEICGCKHCWGDDCSDYTKITRAYTAGIKKALEEVEKLHYQCPCAMCSPERKQWDGMKKKLLGEE